MGLGFPAFIAVSDMYLDFSSGAAMSLTFDCFNNDDWSHTETNILANSVGFYIENGTI